MTDIFGNSGGIRGCFAHVSVTAGSSRGAQLIMPGGATMLPSNSFTDPLLCVGFEGQINESVLFNKCFGDRVYTYAFGHDPTRSSFTVNLLGFLVDGRNYSGVVDWVLNEYKAGKVSKSKDYALLALGNSRPLRGIITGVQTVTIDPQHSLQMFNVSMAMPETY